MSHRLTFFVAAIMLLLGFWLVGQQTRLGAQELPVPTTPPIAENGVAVYESRCASCHGDQGNGDGPLAADAVNPPTAFASPDYRQSAVPAELFNTIKNGRLTRGMPLFGEGSSNPLTDEQIWELVALIYSFATPAESVERGRELAAGAPPPADLAFWFTQSNEMALATLQAAGAFPAELSPEDQTALLDYLRTGSYEYIEPTLLNAPIPNGVLSGAVFNGTTQTAVSNQSVTLRGFTPDFIEAINQTTTTDENGVYQFDIEQVPPNWVYIVSTDYAGVPFASSTSQISRATPTADFPITVYETTTSSEDILIEQLQIIVDFVEDDVQIAELYTFSNGGTAVYVGDDGNPSNGTAQFALPAGATNILFQRGFSVDNFRPAPEVIETGTGFADVEPIRPGRGSAGMLVSYRLPFQPGMSIAHPLPYPTSNAAILAPDTGATISGSGWTLTSQELLQIGQVSNYANTQIQTADALNFVINGRSRVVRDANGNPIRNRNSQSELLVGSIALIGAALFIFLMFNRSNSNVQTADQLLQAIAQLDIGYEKQQLTRSQYIQRRQAAKADLLDLLEEDPNGFPPSK